MTGTVQVAQLLIRQGALLDAPDERGNTALHGAAKAGNVEMIHLLLASGARSSLRNVENKTARDLALEREQFESARVLGAAR